MSDETITVVVGGEIPDPTSAPAGPTLDVLGRVLSGDEAVALVLTDLPDVLVLETRIRDHDVRAVCRRVREWAPATRVLTVSPLDDEGAYTSLVAGAAGSILADAEPAQVAASIVAVARGEGVLQPRMASRLLHDIDSWAQRAADPIYPPPTLTATEREVLAALAAGRSPGAIASAHAVTDRLVNLHAGFAVAKLHRYVLGAETIAAHRSYPSRGGT